MSKILTELERDIIRGKLAQICSDHGVTFLQYGSKPDTTPASALDNKAPFRKRLYKMMQDFGINKVSYDIRNGRYSWESTP